MRISDWSSDVCSSDLLPEIEEQAPFLRDLWAACDAQGIPLEGVISEYSPGQIELKLKHRADVLRATDEAVMYKNADQGVALKDGCVATSQAQPCATLAGQGYTRGWEGGVDRGGE